MTDAAITEAPPPRATRVLPAGSWPAGSACDHITLTYDERHRRRLRFTAAQGTEFLLDLARATVLRAGDGLELTDGRIVAVVAAPEPLLAVTADTPQRLLRLAWHIGNRHLPAELQPGRMLIREDSVIEDMLRGLGAGVEHVLEAFSPEPGAYDHQGHANVLLPEVLSHGHGHGH